MPSIVDSSQPRRAATKRGGRWAPRLTVAGVTTALVAGFASLGLMSAAAPSAQAAPLSQTLPSYVTRLPQDASYNASIPGLVSGAVTYEFAQGPNQADSVPISGWQQAVGAMFTTQASGNNTSQVSMFPQDTVVLAGDTLIGHGAFAGGMTGNYSNLPTGAGIDMSDVWSLEDGYFDHVTLDGAQNLPLTDFTYRQGTGVCASSLTPPREPFVNGNSVAQNLWCMGVGFFDFTATNIAVPSQGTYYKYGFAPDLDAITKLLGSTPAPVYVGGPNLPDLGNNSTNYGGVDVFKPGLQLIKEVCATGTGCDADSVDGDDKPVSDAQENSTGQWVDYATIPLGSTSVQWRITVINTGDIPLEDVHLSADKPTTDPATNDAASAKANDCMTKGQFGDLAVGQSAHITCTTTLDGSLASKLVNDANANGSLPATFVGNNGPGVPLTDVNGNPLSDRFMGNNGEKGMVPSNNDAAMVDEPAPAIKLTKWVCETGTGCDVPAAGSDVLAKLAGTASQPGEAAGGWVKETTVDAGGKADWLIIVTNTGNTTLTKIVISDTAPDPGNGAGASSDPEPTDPALADSLPAGASVVFTSTTQNITTTADYATGHDGDPYMGSYDDGSGFVVKDAYPTAEPTYKTGKDAVNTAAASAIPVGKDGKPLLSPKGKGFTVGSNTSNAEVNAKPPVKPVTPPAKVATGGAVLAAGMPAGLGAAALILLAAGGLVAGLVAKRATRA